MPGHSQIGRAGIAGRSHRFRTAGRAFSGSPGNVLRDGSLPELSDGAGEIIPHPDRPTARPSRRVMALRDIPIPKETKLITRRSYAKEIVWTRPELFRRARATGSRLSPPGPGCTLPCPESTSHA